MLEHVTPLHDFFFKHYYAETNPPIYNLVKMGWVRV